MGTRGFVGFVIDGQEKIGYNHFDSYPDGLGVDVLSWLRGEVHGGTASTLAERDEYAPVALAASWPISALPSDDEFVKALDPQG